MMLRCPTNLLKLELKMNDSENFEDEVWHHDCPVEGPMGVGHEEECTWCGATKEHED